MQDESLLISIIVPAFNVEQYIKRCLDSILAQSYQNFEVIIVDDGSTDNTGVICDHYAESDQRFSVIHSENHGQANARNLGLEISRGSHIQFVDSDDFLHPEMVSSLVSIINLGYDLAIVGYKKVSSDDISIPDLLPPDIIAINKDAFFETMILGQGDEILDGAVLWNKLYARNIISDLKFRDLYAYEDFDFNVRVLSRINSIALDNRPLYYYCNRSDSTVRDIKSLSRRLLSNLSGMMHSFYSVSQDEMTQRGWWLQSIYRKLLSRRFLLEGSAYEKEAGLLMDDFYLKTKKEYYHHPEIPLKERIVFFFFWKFPFLSRLYMRYTQK